MSTKIYNGLKFISSDILKINQQLNDFAVKIEEYTNKKLSQLLATIVTTDIDACTIDGKIPKELEDAKTGIYLYWLHKFSKRWRDLDKDLAQRDTLVDYTCSISIHPLKNNVFLGILFAEHDHFKNMLIDENIAIDYHYQNQTDQPENISDEEWDSRRDDWEEALKFSSIPSRAGFYKELSQKYFPILKPEDILQYIPEFEKRVACTGFELAKKSSGFFDELDKLSIKDKKIDDIELWDAYRKASDNWKSFKETKEGKILIEEKQDYARKILIKDITKDHLLNLDFLHNG